MANLRSSKTRVRRNKKREQINKNRLGSVRTAVKQTRAAIAAGDKEGAKKAFAKAEGSLARAAGKRTIKKRTAARQTSRLAKALKALFK
ncbi:MAG: 30S ribosomal protein S20 [Alphaproteobacteria bacterium]|nr:30S ribosomal protein S20 [Alphaproteobacteria bacterium]